MELERPLPESIHTSTSAGRIAGKQAAKELKDILGLKPLSEDASP
jgi:hypothetical protein